MEEIEKSQSESIEVERKIAAQLRIELLNVSAAKDRLQDASIQLDKQCEQLHDLLKKTKVERDSNAKKCLQLEQQLTDIRAQLAEASDNDQSLQTITRERDRLVEKVTYLTVSVCMFLIQTSDKAFQTLLAYNFFMIIKYSI